MNCPLHLLEPKLLPGASMHTPITMSASKPWTVDQSEIKGILQMSATWLFFKFLELFSDSFGSDLIHALIWYSSLFILGSKLDQTKGFWP